MMRSVFITVGAALLGGTSLWVATDGLAAITAEGARRLSVERNPRPVPPLPVETMHGHWHIPATKGPVLVEFIYTTCPTVCQTSGGDFAELRDHLVTRGLSVPMYSISFDPENDTLDALQGYADLHSATGNPWTISRPKMADLDQLLDVFDVTVIPDGWGGYEHNIAVLLIDKNGAFSGAFDTRAFDRIATAVENAL